MEKDMDVCLPWFNQQANRESANAFCRSRLQTHKAHSRRNGKFRTALTMGARQLDHTNPGLLQIYQFLTKFYVKASYGLSLVNILSTSVQSMYRMVPSHVFVAFIGVGAA